MFNDSFCFSDAYQILHLKALLKTSNLLNTAHLKNNVIVIKDNTTAMEHAKNIHHHVTQLVGILTELQAKQLHHVVVEDVAHNGIGVDQVLVSLI